MPRATPFAGVTDSARFLGSNLLGAVLGGFLEYASLVWGVRALALLALALYALAWLAGRDRDLPAAGIPVRPS